MFKNLSVGQQQLLYLGLKSLIESKSGHGFHNADLGHPVYHDGASGKLSKEMEYADSPERNALFIMLSELTNHLKEQGIADLSYVWWYDFSEWQSFCQFAIEVHQRKRS